MKAFLDPKNHDTATLQPIVKPYPSHELEYYDVTPKVNSPKNNTPENIKPL